MITAHVTKTPFPYWDPMWVWILFGTLDGRAQAIFGRFVALLEPSVLFIWLMEAFN